MIQENRESRMATRFMQLITPLSTEVKLEILSRLSENLKANFRAPQNNKEQLLDKLFGAWSDVDDSFSEEIISSRSSSARDVSFE